MTKPQVQVKINDMPILGPEQIAISNQESRGVSHLKVEDMSDVLAELRTISTILTDIRVKLRTLNYQMRPKTLWERIKELCGIH